MILSSQNKSWKAIQL